MRKRHEKKQTQVDEAILDELLNQPKVRKYAIQMTKDELAMYRETLVSSGLYAQYCRERRG